MALRVYNKRNYGQAMAETYDLHNLAEALEARFQIWIWSKSGWYLEPKRTRESISSIHLAVPWWLTKNWPKSATISMQVRFLAACWNAIEMLNETIGMVSLLWKNLGWSIRLFVVPFFVFGSIRKSKKGFGCNVAISWPLGHWVWDVFSWFFYLRTDPKKTRNRSSASPFPAIMLQSGSISWLRKGGRHGASESRFKNWETWKYVGNIKLPSWK